ncbi:hypothetical protein SAMN05660862_2750 [Sphingobacterium psychroaquaticum]|uniref:Uncharacterized protein n=1 Tax=Sphingobacterium psychroaquaticum TaxID=561061 RepID=A0A1X7KF73_9SPHI|nr:hypothetical protein SAMN05660862_2750 [Sphingobacterium psychroaquaticum]
MAFSLCFYIPQQREEAYYLSGNAPTKKEPTLLQALILKQNILLWVRR